MGACASAQQLYNFFILSTKSQRFLINCFLKEGNVASNIFISFFYTAITLTSLLSIIDGNFSPSIDLLLFVV